MIRKLINAFRSWVELNQKPGFDVHDEQSYYVSLASLQSYWTKENVCAVLDLCNLNEDQEDIRNRFIRIFSVLVYARYPHHIDIFLRSDRDDLQFPSPDFPHELGPELHEISTQQWKFFPLMFTDKTYKRIHKRTLFSGQILPVRYGKPLREERRSGNVASVKEVFIDPDCCQLVQENEQVVFKIYRGDNATRLFISEADIYCRLLGKVDESITRYYGSFSYDGGAGKKPMRVIILEYAAKGNLIDFLKATERPVTPEERKKLWTQLLKLLDGLHVIHYLNESPSSRMKGVHQDIQPANILVFPGDGRSRFDVQFKLTDFGLAEVSKDLSPEGHMAIKNGGSRMYSPPELYVNYTSQEHVKPQVLPITDVWSLGAVYSEVLVWSLSGVDGLEEYREARQGFIASSLNMSARGFDACFHNASERLPIVDEFLQYSLENEKVNDQVSLTMREVILKFMLVPFADRLEAMDVRTRADIKVKGFTESRVSGSFGSGRGSKLVVSDNNLTQPAEGSAQVTHPVARIPDLPHPTASTSGTRPTERGTGQPEPAPERVAFYPDRMTRDREAQTSRAGDVDVDWVYGLLEKKKPKSLSRITRMRGGNHHDIIFHLPGIGRAKRLIDAKGGRDQIILIDNSLSMSRYKLQVARTARVISYLTKKADPNGMDFYLTSEPTKSHKCYSSSEVETRILEASSFPERCDMEDCLSKIMEPVYRGRMRQTSVYIYTDGNWEDNEGVAGVIKKAIAQLVRAGELPSFFMFQFIQFGDDNEGTKRLQDLDDNYVQEHGYGKYDIVDTKPWTDDVSSIVIGSISRGDDKKRSSTQVQGQHLDTSILTSHRREMFHAG